MDSDLRSSVEGTENVNVVTSASPDMPVVVIPPEPADDCNGHSSPDSGVNDMSDDRPSSASGDALSQQPYSQKVTLVHPSTSIRIRMGDTEHRIKGPANITMVSNSGHIPIRPPHGGRTGHGFIQSVDDKGVVHYILTQQPVQGLSHPAGGQIPPSFPYHTPQGIHAPQSFTAYGPGSQQQGFPGFPAQFTHHHPIHPSMIHNGNGSHCPHAEERAQRNKSILREKLALRQKNDIHQHNMIQQQTNLTANHIHMLNPSTHANGTSPKGSPRGQDQSYDPSSCSNSTDSHDDDEKKQLYELLSAIKTPEIEVHSREAVIEIKPPAIPETILNQLPNPHIDVKYNILLKEKKAGAFINVYEGDANSIRLRDLKPATEYHFRVSAILDDVIGQQTEPVIFSTLSAPPDSPNPPKLVSKSKSHILLKWNAAVDNGSRIAHYVLEYCKQTNSADNLSKFEECYRGSKKEHKLNKLPPSTSYLFRLAAKNDIGQSEFSNPVIFSTSGAVPPKPDPPHLESSSVHSMTLSWVRRSSDKEFFLQKEEENSGYGFQPAYSGSDLKYTCDKLRKSTTYKFRIAAANDDGKSPYSDVVIYRTDAAVPLPVHRPIVKGKPTSNMIRLVWEPPTDDGGSAVSSYLAELDGGRGFEMVYEGTELECTCTNLLPGHTYRARVAAKNSVGFSRWSESTHLATKPVPPGSCGKPFLHGKPKAHHLHIKWTQPEYDGGSPVKEYEVKLINMDNTSRECYKGPDLDCVVAGLSPGRSYLLQVRAVNGAGEGKWSEAAQVLSGAGNPEPPAAPRCCAKSPHSILVSWQVPCNNGAKISEYRLEFLKPHDDTFTQVYSGDSLSHEVKTLQPHTDYQFRVCAINSSGPSLFSNPTTCKTLASSPSAVSHIRASPAANSISLTWKQPDSNGSEITGYNIEYGKRQGLSVAADLTECVLEELEPDTVYRVRIQAINAVGAGTFSSTVKINTQLLPPTPPELECSGYTWNTVRLKWSEVEKCDQYTVWKTLSSSQPHMIYQGSSHQCKVSKLQEDSTYSFTISASNSAGEGPMSNPLMVTTSRAPPHALKAPSVDDIGDTECLISWSCAKLMSRDKLHYRLQLSEPSSDYKQIYQGENTKYHLTGLSPGSTYTVRVCPLRLCSGGDAEILSGAYSPGATFKTNKPTPIAPKPKASETPTKSSIWKDRLQQLWKSAKPDPEKQYALGVLFLLFIASLFLSWLALHILGQSNTV